MRRLNSMYECVCECFVLALSSSLRMLKVSESSTKLFLGCELANCVNISRVDFPAVNPQIRICVLVHIVGQTIGFDDKFY